jgi:uncharacterized FlaG/YvyC family protein
MSNRKYLFLLLFFCATVVGTYAFAKKFYPWDQPTTVDSLNRKIGEAGDFYSSMSSGARKEYEEQITEINKCIEDVKSAQRRGDTQLEAKLRKNLSKLYNDLAVIVENDGGNIIRNNPSKSSAFGNFAKNTRATAREVAKEGAFLPKTYD